MKRNKQQATRSMRHGGSRPDELGDSKYAQKVKSGKQKYGPGCCAHERGKRS